MSRHPPETVFLPSDKYRPTKMPRLVVDEPPQHGQSTGSAIKRKRVATPEPRNATAARTSPATIADMPPAARKRKAYMSKDRQAALAFEYQEIQHKVQKRAARKLAVEKLCQEYGCGPQYPRQVVASLKKRHALPLSRAGKAGRKERITVAEGERLKELLRENAWDMTFRQIELETGYPSSTVQRYMKRHKWRLVGKGTRPVITDEQIKQRLAWAQKLEDNEWTLHVDIDEKWFYVWSHGGKLKLPPGEKKPTQRLASKRYVGKIMMLVAIARPDPRHNFDGKIGCWRVCTVRKAKKGDKRTGLKKGDPLKEDKSMDTERFLRMMKTDVIRAIHAKLPNAPKVSIQFDNAPGHATRAAKGKQTVSEALARQLAEKRGGRGPQIEIVTQVANSPDTNACDLGFFRSLDTHLPRKRSMKLNAFEEEVMTAFNNYPSEKLSAIFDQKMRVCKAIIADGGNNQYKMPHRRDSEKNA